MNRAPGSDFPAARFCLRASAEHLVQFAAGIAVAELRERSLLGDLAGGTHKTGPGGARQRTADADAANAEIGGFRDGKKRRPDQKIDRLRMHRLHDRRYLLLGL